MVRKRLLCITLSVAMIMTTLFAGTGAVFASENPEVSDEMVTVQKLDNMTPKSTEEELDTIYAKTMMTSAYTAPAYDKMDYDPLNYYIYKVTAKDYGVVYLDITTTGKDGDIIYVAAGELEGGNEFENFVPAEGCEGQLEANTTMKNAMAIGVNKNESFYVCFVTPEENQDYMTAGLRARLFTTGTRQLAQDTSSYVIASGINAYGNTKAQTWFKIKPSTTGRMEVILKEFGWANTEGTVQLFDSNKEKALSDKVTYSTKNSNARAYFGVTAGTTYWLKVEGCKGTKSMNYKFGVKYNILKRTDRAMGYTNYAKEIKKGAAATYTLFPATGTTNNDFYKFYVPSSKITQIKINTAGIKSGKVYVNFYYKPTGKSVEKFKSVTINNVYTAKNSNGTTYNLEYGPKDGKTKAGWYYVRVRKGSPTSGSYYIKYVK